MSELSADHTQELEVRLRAIRIQPEDSCVFFQLRDGCALAIRQCRYCHYGKFSDEADSRYCRFKR